MNGLEKLIKGKHREPAKAAQEKLSVAKANLERKKGELEVLRRKKGKESSKTEPNNGRLEYFDDWKSSYWDLKQRSSQLEPSQA